MFSQGSLYITLTRFWSAFVRVVVHLSPENLGYEIPSVFHIFFYFHCITSSFIGEQQSAQKTIVDTMRANALKTVVADSRAALSDNILWTDVKIS